MPTPFLVVASGRDHKCFGSLHKKRRRFLYKITKINFAEQ